MLLNYIQTALNLYVSSDLYNFQFQIESEK